MRYSNERKLYHSQPVKEPSMRKHVLRFGVSLALAASAIGFGPASVNAQDAHDHTAPVSGVPQGVPYFCANPSVTSTATGLWTDSTTWSTGKVPGANDKIRIAAGHV